MREGLKNEREQGEPTQESAIKNSERSSELSEATVAQSEAETQSELGDLEGELSALKQLMSDSEASMSAEEKLSMQEEINELSREIGVVGNESPTVEAAPNETTEGLTESEIEHLNALNTEFSNLSDNYLHLHAALNALGEMQGRRSIAEDAEVIRENINGWQALMAGLPDRVQDIMRHPEDKQAILDEFSNAIASIDQPLQDETDRAASWAGRIRETYGDYDEVNGVDTAFRALSENMDTAKAALRNAGG